LPYNSMQRRMFRHVSDDGKFGTPLAHPCRFEVTAIDWDCPGP